MGETNFKKQSICIVSATPLSVYFFLKPHIAALAKQYNVSVVFDPRNDDYLGDLGLEARVVPINMTRKLNPFQDFFSLFYLYKFFRKNQFDLIVSVAPKAGMLSMIAASLASHSKRVHIFQGEFWASKKGLLRSILKQVDSLTANLAHQVLAVSESEKKFLAQEKIIQLEKIDVLGEGSICGVDIVKYQFNSDVRSLVRQELKIPIDAVVALFMGRIVADKGIFELMDSFKNTYKDCPNLYLLIVGPDEGAIKEGLFSSIGKAQDRVRLVGFTRTPERYMSAADFFCLPSYREGFPISILDAAAAGIPTIGTSIYGISDAVQDGKTGLLVAPRNAKKLREAISRLYQNHELRNILGANAKARVIDLFQQNIVVKRYVDYLSGAIHSRRPGIYYLFLQRTIDIVLSGLALLALAIPMLLIGVCIAISSKGPLIYWSDRVGKNNILFRMAKFRTMKINTPVLATDLLANPTQYITSIGRFLRKSSLDELPQLWNILRGDMSFIGPRPALFNQSSLIEMRTDVGVDYLRPGLTGWAQVNGRDEISDEEKVQLDLWYMQHASLSLNLKILCLTFLKVFRSDGVSH
jgi:lipopolysaccharide/colanic/teichoic acid biosynthesis glycosyltransferase